MRLASAHARPWNIAPVAHSANRTSPKPICLAGIVPRCEVSAYQAWMVDVYGPKWSKNSPNLKPNDDMKVRLHSLDPGS